MSKRTRTDYLKECPAFGLDEDGSPGYDPDEKSCQYCATNDGEMHDACRKECSPPAAEPKTEPETAEPEAEPAVETASVPDAPAEPKAKKTSAPQPTKTDSPNPKPTGPASPSTNKPGAATVLAGLLTKGHKWNYKELVTAVAAGSKDKLVFAGLATSTVVAFGVSAGLIRDEGKGKNRTVELI